MEQHHINKVREQCRVCGCLLVPPTCKERNQGVHINTQSLKHDLHSVLSIDTHSDAVSIYLLMVSIAAFLHNNFKHTLHSQHNPF